MAHCRNNLTWIMNIYRGRETPQGSLNYEKLLLHTRECASCDTHLAAAQTAVLANRPKPKPTRPKFGPKGGK